MANTLKSRVQKWEMCVFRSVSRAVRGLLIAHKEPRHVKKVYMIDISYFRYS